MKTQNLVSQYNQLLKWRNRLTVGIIAFFCLNCLQSVSLYALIGRQKTIIVPAHLSREVSIGAHFSDSYLEQMAHYFAALFLNITPATFNTHATKLLEHVASESFAVVKAQLAVQQEEINKRGISTTFHATSFKVNQKALWVELKGDLKIFVSNLPLESKTKTYRMEFLERHGQLYLKKISEVENV